MHFKDVMAYILAGTMNFTGACFADSCMELTIKSWIWKKLPIFWLKQATEQYVTLIVDPLKYGIGKWISSYKCKAWSAQ